MLLLASAPSITFCSLTGSVQFVNPARILVMPTKANGLDQPSLVQIDGSSRASKIGFAIESELHLLNWEPQTQASSFGWGFRDASGVALIHWDIRDGLVDAETAALALKSRPGTVIERERHLLTLMRYTELSPARGPCGCIPGIAS